MHAQLLLPLTILLSPLILTNALTVQISLPSTATISTSQPCLCLTQQRGYFCGSRSIPGNFNPDFPVFTGDCDVNTRYTCVARGHYPFEPREKVDCGYEGCVEVGGNNEAFGYDDCKN